ncbi:POU domain, class 3, transcription factor 2-A [Pelobates cultripes]|uniref:POU domain, class 3, transcription factor 2-A n=1 Tax=Pelobates cultripes TaxID=61616 RepID=A0AAD1W3B9_PELCU|nr:POU domain, class 3, transcription factor 2-A [Pelobates cultripes]
MNKNYLYTNQGDGDLRILPTGHENYQENMQDVTGMGHPPYSQNKQDYDYNVIQRDDGQCPPQKRNLMNQFPHYYNGPTQPNAYYTMNSGQPWIPPLNQNQTPDYLNQVSPHEAASPVSMNRPTSPQVMSSAAQAGQIKYPMLHYQKPSPAMDENCTPMSTISSAGSCTSASTISQASTGSEDSDVVDNSSMSELEEFAHDVKKQRYALGLTQENVGNGLGVLYNKSFSQTTISRFEAVQLSLTNMRKLKPMLKKFYDEVKTNPAILQVVEKGEKPNNSVKRQKRTFIDKATKQKLEESYKHVPHPSKMEIGKISKGSQLEIEVVRTWFCNRRQKDKKELNKLLKEALASGNFAQPIPGPNTGTCAMPPVEVPQPCLIDITGSNRTPYMAINDYNRQFIQYAP